MKSASHRRDTAPPLSATVRSEVARRTDVVVTVGGFTALSRRGVGGLPQRRADHGENGLAHNRAQDAVF